MKEPSPNNNSDIHQLNIHQPTANISTFECNILISTQLEQLSKAIDKLFDGIDLIIDNGLSVHTVHQSSNEFITSISNSLLATINVRCSLFIFVAKYSTIHAFVSQLLMFFVPKMKYSLGGHVVSIQSASSDMPIPLFDPCGEIQRLVRLLTTNNTGASIESVPVQLTTVLFNRNDGREGSASNTNSKMDVTNVVEQIIAGIQRNRSLIQIKESTSLMQTILNFFPKII